MKQKPVKVFLDANVVIEEGKPPGGPLFARVVDLVKGGFISVLTTDLTKTEVAKKHTENDFGVIKEIGRPHFRSIAIDALDVDLPDIDKAEIKKKLTEKYVAETNKMFTALEAKTLSIDSVPPSTVFSDYAQEKGFFSGVGKKNQFPDAFMFECLKSEASEQTPVFIITQDGDFDASCKQEDHIHVLKSIPDLFKALGLEVEEPSIEDFLEGNEDEVLEFVNTELKDWWLIVTDVEDAEIDEITVKNVDVIDYSSFGRTVAGDEILVIGSMTITADVSFSHPDWDGASWNSEDKVLIPHSDVSGETEIELAADFSMSILVDEEDKPDQVHELGFRNDDFVWVTLYPFETYK